MQGRSAACGFHSGGGPDIRDDENDGGRRKFRASAQSDGESAKGEQCEVRRTSDTVRPS